MVVTHIGDIITCRIADQCEVIATAAAGVLLEVAHTDTICEGSGSAFVLEREVSGSEYLLLRSYGDFVLVSCRNSVLVLVGHLGASICFADSTTSRGRIELPVLLRALDYLAGM